MASQKEIVDIDLEFQTVKGRGACFRDDKGKDYWLPLSEIEYHPQSAQRGDVVTVTLPSWLAEKSDLA